MGGGRSNLDNQRGFSNQGIGSFSRPNAFSPQDMNFTNPSRSNFTGNTIPFEEEDTIMKNFIRDGSGMVTDTIINPAKAVAKKFPPGLLGLFGRMGESIGNNREDHKYLNSIYGRTGPDKTMAFFDKAIMDSNRNMGTDNVSTMSMGDTSRGSSLGQALKYFQRAGISDQSIAKFQDPNDKFYGNQAYLASQAGDSGAEDFNTGMSFIKNAKSSANLARETRDQINSRNESRGNAYNDFFNQPGNVQEDITESISYDDFFNRPGNNENAYNNFFNNSDAITNEEENLEGLTYNQRFNEDLNANPYNDFFNQPGNNAFPPQTQKKIPSYLNNGLGFFDENEDGEQYYRY